MPSLHTCVGHQYFNFHTDVYIPIVCKHLFGFNIYMLACTVHCLIQNKFLSLI